MSSLSAGPIGPSDKIGLTNKSKWGRRERREEERGREGGGRKYCFFLSILYLLYDNIIINFFILNL